MPILGVNRQKVQVFLSIPLSVHSVLSQFTHFTSGINAMKVFDFCPNQSIHKANFVPSLDAFIQCIAQAFIHESDINLILIVCTEGGKKARYLLTLGDVELIQSDEVTQLDFQISLKLPQQREV